LGDLRLFPFFLLRTSLSCRAGIISCFAPYTPRFPGLPFQVLRFCLHPLNLVAERTPSLALPCSRILNRSRLSLRFLPPVFLPRFSLRHALLPPSLDLFLSSAMSWPPDRVLMYSFSLPQSHGVFRRRVADSFWLSRLFLL